MTKLTPFKDWVVGDLVYESFNPKKTGKVISIRIKKHKNVDVYGGSVDEIFCKVKWLDGSISETSNLRYLEYLVQETETKFKNHSKRLQQARNL